MVLEMMGIMGHEGAKVVLEIAWKEKDRKKKADGLISKGGQTMWTGHKEAKQAKSSKGTQHKATRDGQTANCKTEGRNWRITTRGSAGGTMPTAQFVRSKEGKEGARGRMQGREGDLRESMKKRKMKM
eukprot:TRINITY_DN25005_c0_g1_i1.p2 TRINITY_DN25005_c0_g1~~TRINITY_DN25005_c0_g1_i1.p2  ORF type:complete len:137 (+),score=29.42 TRINITY_DN25005_c0_g1_i1:28-411(+)